MRAAGFLLLLTSVACMATVGKKTLRFCYDRRIKAGVNVNLSEILRCLKTG